MYKLLEKKAKPIIANPKGRIGDKAVCILSEAFLEEEYALVMKRKTGTRT